MHVPAVHDPRMVAYFVSPPCGGPVAPARVPSPAGRCFGNFSLFFVGAVSLQCSAVEGAAF